MILVTGALLATALGASLLAGRLRVPGLVAFLGIGMAVGSDGFGWIDFSDYKLERNIGIVALGLILFEGGLASSIDELRPVAWPALSLAIVGTILTAVITGLVAWWLFDFTTLQAMLAGSIVAGTDGAAIFAVLRGSTLNRRLALTLEGEAGINDPVAVILVLGFVHWLQNPDYGIEDMALLFVQELSIGAVVGVAVGIAASRSLQRLRLGSAGLYPVASLASAAIAYGLADVAHGSGFLAVYLCGLLLGSSDIPARRTIVTFHEGLAWVAQLGMFLTLGLLVFPSELGEVAGKGTLLALLVVFVSRPLATVISLVGARFSLREQALIGWAGLRGAVPVVLATFPILDGVPRSDEYFNIVFFAVLLSTVLQGTTIEPFARWLGVTSDEPARMPSVVEVGTIRELGGDVVEHVIREGDAAAGARLRDLGLPRDALVSLIMRGDEVLLPRGSTRLEAGDRMLVLVRREVAGELPAIIDRWRKGPVTRPVRPPRTYTGSVPIYTARPWSAADGDPAHPQAVGGIAVVEHVRTRRDVPGALVVLEDGRYAVTGPILMLGPPGQLQTQARRRLVRARGDAEISWWQEVIGACAL